MSKKSKSPQIILKENLQKLLKTFGYDIAIPNDVPKKWEKHGDLILLPINSFEDPLWLEFGDKLWDTISISLKCQRIAKKSKIQNDEFRSSQIQLIKGTDGWVTHIDNKIKYSYDITKCMFSIGNISEKLRIAKFKCEGEIIVDMYAGIGYFTLPFLLHAKASLIHACEWNPNAIEALEKNLYLNHVKEKCIIHFGDNRKVCPEGVADRVYLGLIPSSEEGWKTACKALNPLKGGILHIHGNVTSGLKNQFLNIKENKTKDNELEKRNFAHNLEWTKWAKTVCINIKEIFFQLSQNEWNIEIISINKVKSYAPHIDHIVVDLKCKPSICNNLN